MNIENRIKFTPQKILRKQIDHSVEIIYDKNNVPRTENIYIYNIEIKHIREEPEFIDQNLLE